MTFSGVTNAGADWISKNGIPGEVYINWGGGLEPDLTSTELDGEFSEGRVSATIDTSVPATWTIDAVQTSTTSEPKTITNMGVFSEPTGGVLIFAAGIEDQIVDFSDWFEFNVAIPFLSITN
jgi:hypothetical protein